MSYSLQPYGLWTTRLLCTWDSPGKNTGVGCHALLQGIFPTKGWNLCLLHLHWQVSLYCWATGESPDYKGLRKGFPKGNQSWISIGKTDAEAPILWPSDVKKWLIGKDPDARRDWRQEEKGTREDEMVGWHHWLDEHELEEAPGVGDGQGSLACCSSWCFKELDMTERLNWTEGKDKGWETGIHLAPTLTSCFNVLFLFNLFDDPKKWG